MLNIKLLYCKNKGYSLTIQAKKYVIKHIMETELKINYEHEAGILAAIEKHPIFSFNDIFVYYKACSRATAYNHHLDKLDSIKEAIYSNRRKGVSTMLSKWVTSGNATLQLAAMRMICDKEEHRSLNQNYSDLTTGGEKIQNGNTIITFE